MSKLFHKCSCGCWFFIPTKQEHTRLDSFNQLMGRIMCALDWLEQKPEGHIALYGIVWTCLGWVSWVLLKRHWQYTTVSRCKMKEKNSYSSHRNSLEWAIGVDDQAAATATRNETLGLYFSGCNFYPCISNLTWVSDVFLCPCDLVKFKGVKKWKYTWLTCTHSFLWTQHTISAFDPFWEDILEDCGKNV